jgi:hypothetical protein
MDILGSARFIFFRLSAFLFDMLFLSFLISISLIVIFNFLNAEVKVLDVIYQLSVSNSIFKSFIYLVTIGTYYGIYVYFKKATLGLWVTHQDFAERRPEISKESHQDKDMLEDVGSGKVKKVFGRLFNAFLYSSLQMINISLLGALTFVAGFKKNKTPYHEAISGIHIVSRKTVN